eukprot:UN21523
MSLFEKHILVRKRTISDFKNVPIFKGKMFSFGQNPIFSSKLIRQKELGYLFLSY